MTIRQGLPSELGWRLLLHKKAWPSQPTGASMGGATVSAGLDLVLARIGGLGGHGGAQQLNLGLGLLLEGLELLVGGLV